MSSSGDGASKARGGPRDVARVDTHIPTVTAAGNRTRTGRAPGGGAHAGPGGESSAADATWPARALAGGLLLGVGLGAFLDGIVLHQLLQWHHMLTDAGQPSDTVRGLEVNTLADGIFHAAAWVVTLLGAWLLASAGTIPRSPRRFAGTLLAGWGLFNLVEGLVDHILLGVHHVNERVPADERIYWDLGLLALSGAVLAIGVSLLRPARGRAEEG